MIKRIVEISQGSFVHVAHQQLIIERDGQRLGSVPLEDLGVLLLANPAIHLTQAVLYLADSYGIMIVVCNAQYLPVSIVLPFSQHTLHSKILRQQIAASLPCQKRAWQQITQAKIQAQAQTLIRIGQHEDASYLLRMVSRVQSGDPDNLEAQAAHYYWPRLFGNDFRRDPNLADGNILLNYGYAVLRSTVARAVVGSGLHPALGVHHHNQYDSLALADDLMEPLRPRVDWLVWEMVKTGVNLLNSSSKKQLLGLLAEPVSMGEQSLPLMVALPYYMASFKTVIFGESKKMEIPQ